MKKLKIFIICVVLAIISILIYLLVLRYVGLNYGFAYSIDEFPAPPGCPLECVGKKEKLDCYDQFGWKTCNYKCYGYLKSCFSQKGFEVVYPLIFN